MLALATSGLVMMVINNGGKMKEAKDKKPSTARNNMWENTGQTGLTSQLCYCYGRRKLPDRKNAKPDLQLWLFSVELSVFVVARQSWQSYQSFIIPPRFYQIIWNVIMRKEETILLKMCWEKHSDNCVFLWQFRETEIWRDKPRKYDPYHEVFMSGNTSDCHIATLISSGQHSAHFSSLALQKYFNICKKTPRRSRTGSQLRVEWWGIIFGINIWAIWWRSTRHRPGDESLENAELRVIPGCRVAVVVEADFYNITVFRILKSLEYVVQTRTVGKRKV